MRVWFFQSKIFRNHETNQIRSISCTQWRRRRNRRHEWALMFVRQLAYGTFMNYSSLGELWRFDRENRQQFFKVSLSNRKKNFAKSVDARWQSCKSSSTSSFDVWHLECRRSEGGDPTASMNEVDNIVNLSTCLSSLLMSSTKLTTFNFVFPTRFSWFCQFGDFDFCFRFWFPIYSPNLHHSQQQWSIMAHQNVSIEGKRVEKMVKKSIRFRIE